MAGNPAWCRQFGSYTLEEVYGVATDGTGVYVAGWTYGTLPGQTSAGYSDFLVLKFSTIPAPEAVGTFRPTDGAFYLDYNGNGQWDGCGTDRCLSMGLNGDIPLVGDWNGSGTAKVGTFRPIDGAFYLDYNRNGQWDGCGTDRCLHMGMNGDIPLVGKW